jgi:hypothetical protein
MGKQMQQGQPGPYKEAFQDALMLVRESGAVVAYPSRSVCRLERVSVCDFLTI